MNWRNCLRSLAGSFSTCSNLLDRRVSRGFLVAERIGFAPRSWTMGRISGLPVTGRPVLRASSQTHVSERHEAAPWLHCRDPTGVFWTS